MEATLVLSDLELDLLFELVGEPAGLACLADALDVSLSTCERALDRLRAAELISLDRASGLWAASATGEKLLLENDTLIRAKSSIDGAASLGEAARMLRDYADWLDQMERSGFRLRHPVVDDYGFVRRNCIPPSPIEATGRLRPSPRSSRLRRRFRLRPALKRKDPVRSAAGS